MRAFYDSSLSGAEIYSSYTRGAAPGNLCSSANASSAAAATAADAAFSANAASSSWRPCALRRRLLSGFPAGGNSRGLLFRIGYDWRLQDLNALATMLASRRVKPLLLVRADLLRWSLSQYDSEMLTESHPQFIGERRARALHPSIPGPCASLRCNPRPRLLVKPPCW